MYGVGGGMVLGGGMGEVGGEGGVGGRGGDEIGRGKEGWGIGYEGRGDEGISERGRKGRKEMRNRWKMRRVEKKLGVVGVEDGWMMWKEGEMRVGFEVEVGEV